MSSLHSQYICMYSKAHACKWTHKNRHSMALHTHVSIFANIHLNICFLSLFFDRFPLVNCKLFLLQTTTFLWHVPTACVTPTTSYTCSKCWEVTFSQKPMSKSLRPQSFQLQPQSKLCLLCSTWHPSSQRLSMANQSGLFLASEWGQGCDHRIEHRLQHSWPGSVRQMNCRRSDSDKNTFASLLTLKVEQSKAIQCGASTTTVTLLPLPVLLAWPPPLSVKKRRHQACKKACFLVLCESA